MRPELPSLTIGMALHTIAQGRLSRCFFPTPQSAGNIAPDVVLRVSLKCLQFQYFQSSTAIKEL